MKGRFVSPGNPKRPYVAALLKDNPAVDYDTYVESLMELHPTRREQMLAGDWEAREPGDYWAREWIEYVEQGPPHSISTKIRFWDLASSVKDTACHTAGVLQSLDVYGYYTIEDSDRFRLRSGDRDARIKKQAIIDGRRVVVGIEQEPGSGGKDQAEDLAAELEALGFTTWIFRPDATSGGKTKRAEPVTSKAQDTFGEDGKLLEPSMYRVAVGDLASPHPWVAPMMGRMEGFPSSQRSHDGKILDADEWDAVSGGFRYLTDHPPVQGDPYDLSGFDSRSSPLDEVGLAAPD